jgi:hypothetical protein
VSLLSLRSTTRGANWAVPDPSGCPATPRDATKLRSSTLTTSHNVALQRSDLLLQAASTLSIQWRHELAQKTQRLQVDTFGYMWCISVSFFARVCAVPPLQEGFWRNTWITWTSTYFIQILEPCCGAKSGLDMSGSDSTGPLDPSPYELWAPDCDRACLTFAKSLTVQASLSARAKYHCRQRHRMKWTCLLEAVVLFLWMQGFTLQEIAILSHYTVDHVEIRLAFCEIAPD